jgi:hypothetical protein
MLDLSRANHPRLPSLLLFGFLSGLQELYQYRLALFVIQMPVGSLLFLRANNNYTNFSFSGFLKEYSIVGIFLKEKFIIKIKISDESLLGFYYLLP